MDPKKLSDITSMYLVMGEYFNVGDLSIKREMKKIMNAKPHKNRGTRINPRTEPKIGRNELCPCESGKKYKNCCLKNK